MVFNEKEFKIYFSAKTIVRLLLFIFVIFSIHSPLSLTFEVANAQTQADLQAKIEARNKDIEKLLVEINSYQKQIDELGSQADTLTAAVKSLDLTKKKLEADIAVTQNKIAAKNLEIERLGGQIKNKEEDISDDHRVIKSALSLIYQTDNKPISNVFLGTASISDAFDSLNNIGELQGRVVARVNDLRVSKATLESSKQATEDAKVELVKLNKQLGDQRKVVLDTQDEKNDLLKATKDSESQYKKILAQKQAQKEQFEKEIANYEVQIKTIVSAASLPKTGSGVLSWPLDKVTITQYFGYTEFATANPQVYKGTGHNGIDLRASVGTPIKAALSGVVVGVGNSDLKKGCYSYGKWVMVRHDNGLSTLYAHLSLQKVAKGQTVSTGELLGYSGNTGYTTGPHLHFGVYATEGVQITAVKSTTPCNGIVIPLASYSAYLNPLSYL